MSWNHRCKPARKPSVQPHSPEHGSRCAVALCYPVTPCQPATAVKSRSDAIAASRALPTADHAPPLPVEAALVRTGVLACVCQAAKDTVLSHTRAMIHSRPACTGGSHLCKQPTPCLLWRLAGVLLHGQHPCGTAEDTQQRQQRAHAGTVPPAGEAALRSKRAHARYAQKGLLEVIKSNATGSRWLAPGAPSAASAQADSLRAACGCAVRSITHFVKARSTTVGVMRRSSTPASRASLANRAESIWTPVCAAESASASEGHHCQAASERTTPDGHAPAGPC